MKVGIGIIGLDNWYHALPLCPFPSEEIPKSNFVGFSDPNEDRVKAMQLPEKWKGKYYTDYRDLLANSKIDAVIIDAYTAAHGEIAVAAAQAGKHVMVDKPFATKLEDSDMIIEAAKKAGVKLMTAYNFRFRDPYMKIKEIIDKGLLGKPLHGMISTIASLPEGWPGTGAPGWYGELEKGGGGGFQDHAAHTIDIMRWLFNSEAQKVSAEMANLMYKNIENEDYGIATISLKNGAVCVVEASWTSLPRSGFGETVQIRGEKGDLFYKPPYMRVCSETKPFNEPMYVKVEEPMKYVLRETHTRIVKHFVDCIVEDKRPSVTGEDGRASLEVLLAAYESAELRKPVELQ
jgi:predicted dehydrogenase